MCSQVRIRLLKRKATFSGLVCVIAGNDKDPFEEDRNGRYATRHLKNGTEKMQKHKKWKTANCMKTSIRPPNFAEKVLKIHLPREKFIVQRYSSCNTVSVFLANICAFFHPITSKQRRDNILQFFKNQQMKKNGTSNKVKCKLT